MAEKVTVMVLKVDLQCPCCYRKVKKILCQFPQIRDRVFDEKKNTVTITVVCCNPEKLRDKLCCKGSRVIQSIEIKEPTPPPTVPPTQPPTRPPTVPPTQPPTRPPTIPPTLPPTRPPTTPPTLPNPPKSCWCWCPCSCPPPMQRPCCWECCEGNIGWPCWHGCRCNPPLFSGPCYHGFRVPPPPPPAQPCCGCHGQGCRDCHVFRYDYIICDEHPQSCSTM